MFYKIIYAEQINRTIKMYILVVSRTWKKSSEVFSVLDWQLLIIVIRGIIWRRSDLVRANKKNKKKRRKKNWWKLDLVQKVEKKQRFIHWITCFWIRILQFGSQIAVTNRNYSIISAREKYRMARTEMAELLRLSCHRELRTITLDMFTST